MFEAGPRAIFSAIATSAFLQCSLRIRSLNYDTTSMVMWGEYEGDDERIGTISITLGHSKDKRGDKNQLKIGLGTADSVIVDAKVLSGNTDDKTYRNDALDDADILLERHGFDRVSFKTMTRRIAKEKAELDKSAKQYAKRDYACQPDAEKEIVIFTTKRLPKVQYHRVEFQIVEEERRGRGRPKKNQPR